MVTSPNYIFNPQLSEGFRNYAEHVGYFSPPECDSIMEMGHNSTIIQGTIGESREVNIDIRKSKIGWIECLHANAWLWHKLGHIANEVNDLCYKFKLLGFKECVQFTRYDGDGDHYGWHMDFGPGPNSVRKLSVTVQLSEPEEYVGGDLELWYGVTPSKATKTRGTVIIFPSYTMHRVTPVTSGTRYSAVVWVSGHEPYR